MFRRKGCTGGAGGVGVWIVDFPFNLQYDFNSFYEKQNPTVNVPLKFLVCPETPLNLTETGPHKYLCDMSVVVVVQWY